jgi:hypothetical protein
MDIENKIVYNLKINFHIIIQFGLFKENSKIYLLLIFFYLIIIAIT